MVYLLVVGWMGTVFWYSAELYSVSFERLVSEIWIDHLLRLKVESSVMSSLESFRVNPTKSPPNHL